MTEQERADACRDKIVDALNEYGFTIAGDWNGDAYIKDDKTGETYTL